MGTQCYGLVILGPWRRQKPTTPGLSWVKYRIRRVISSRYKNHPPLSPIGRGLPGDLVNAILVSTGGTVWVGTDSGLAWSRNRGRNWRFVRGRDWKAKDQQLDSPPPQKTIAALARRASDAELLSGDHVTCLAEGASGRLWIGLWRNGFNVLNPRTGAIFRSLARPVPILVKKLSPQLPRDYVSSLLPLPGGGMLVGYYGGGIEQWGNLRGDDWPAGQHVPPREPMPNPPIMPRAAAPATSKRLAAEKAALAHAVRLRLIRSGKPRAVALDQDWITQGAWLGRYGTY